MVKYLNEWAFDGKSGVTYYLEDGGKAYKIDEVTFNALPADVIFIGKLHTFTDKNTGKTNSWFTSK